MQRAKEAASNVAASAKSGMEKTKASLEEKGGKMSTLDPARKEMAEEKRDERYHEAERQKQEAHDENAAARRGHDYGYTAGTYTGSGRTGVLDTDRDVDEDRDRAREGDRPGVQDPRVTGGARTGYGTGSTY